VLALSALISRPVSGVIADRLNKKHVLVLSTAVNAGLLLSYPFADSISLLMLIRFIHGISFAVSTTTIVALASSFIPQNRMGEGIGFFGVGFIAAVAVGPVIGITILEHFDFLGLFIVSAATAGVSAGLMALVRYKHEKKERYQAKLQLRIADFIEVKLIPLALFVALFQVGQGFIHSFIAIFGEERDIASVGLYFTVNALTMLVIRPLSGWLNDRRGIAAILIPGYAISAVGMFMLAGAGSLWMVILPSILLAAGHGAAQPGIQAEGIRMLPDKRGVATSTVFLGIDAGQALGPIIGGAALGAFDFTTTFIGAGALMVFGMIAFALYRKQLRK
jgi:predicted MFS family arabinose efflux permease